MKKEITIPVTNNRTVTLSCHYVETSGIWVCTASDEAMIDLEQLFWSDGTHKLDTNNQITISSI